MKLQALIKEIKKSIPSILNESGSIVYSSVSTICKGDLYLMGFNPGGEVDNNTISHTLDELPKQTENLYKIQDWSSAKKTYHEGGHPLQKNYLQLVPYLTDGEKEVFSTNLIFTRSRNAKGSDYPYSAKTCWPVHQLFIKAIDPKCFIVFGNSSQSPYDFIKKEYDLQDNGCLNSGHGNWKCFSSLGVIEGRERLLIGVPHLSRYYILNYPYVMKWIKDKIDNFK